MGPLELLDARIDAQLGQLDLGAAARPGRMKLLRTEHAVIVISAFAQDNLVMCRLAAVLLADVDPSLDLLHRLFRANTELTMGTLQLFEDRTVVLVITLPDSALDGETFPWAIRYLAQRADALAPALQATARGRTGSQILERSACSL
jgi:hypothetical protein